MRADAALPGHGPARRSFHSKYIVFDHNRVFIGSLNLDPRSLYLNTELGVVLESTSLADALRESFNLKILPDNAWQVRYSPEGIRWHSSAGTLDEQPATGNWQRFLDTLMGLLPVTHQL